MIGPGTGIAPFRGFMQERQAKGAQGKNWLFFGERNEQNHFYYGDFWKGMQKQGSLHLTTAFSRDQSEKIYVQHRIAEHGKTLWTWIQDGAHIYICGDAENMAKAVEACFLSIFQSHGNLTNEAARTFLQDLRKQKRYLTDVY
jgi:sulfite reductase (NADPH) flavoprotein alpha-component